MSNWTKDPLRFWLSRHLHVRRSGHVAGANLDCMSREHRMSNACGFFITSAGVLADLSGARLPHHCFTRESNSEFEAAPIEGVLKNNCATGCSTEYNLSAKTPTTRPPTRQLLRPNPTALKRLIVIYQHSSIARRLLADRMTGHETACGLTSTS